MAATHRILRPYPTGFWLRPGQSKSFSLTAGICIALLTMVFSLHPFKGISQDAFEQRLLQAVVATPTSGSANQPLYPNDAAQGIMIPSGFGGYGTYLYGDISGAYPEVYTDNQVDFITSAGFCVGDPEKWANIALGVNMTSPGRFTDFSGNIVVSRSLGKGSSLSAGCLQFLANDRISDAPQPSFYLAFSHAIQTLPSKVPGGSKLTYTIGIGTGRFEIKSGKDEEEGRGKYGTLVFGGLSYELFKHVNLNAEWSGQNLAISTGIRPFKNPVSLSFGVMDLTRYSSDKPNFIFSIGYPLSLNR